MRYTKRCRTTFLIFLMVTATALIIGSSLKSPITVAAQSSSKYEGYTGSTSCRECHEKFYRLWAPSHHGLAMQTESELLLEAGVAAAQATWEAFKTGTGWTDSTPDRIICHQVGSVHRRRLYETLKLDVARDFSTFEVLGNTGSAALPVTLTRAAAAGVVRSGDRVALLGIGSGINCLMLGMEW